MSHPSSLSNPPQSLAPVTLWRLVIVFAALYGPYQVMAQFAFGWSEIRWEGLAELSQLASVLVAVSYLVLALFPLFTWGKRHEPGSSWWRGGLAVTMLLVCVTSIFVLGNGGQLDHNGFLFEHLVTPLLVVLDFIFVGRGQFRTKWWHPLTWIAIPLAYFGFMQYAEVFYGSLFDPAEPTFVVTVAAFFTGVVIFGYVLYGCAKLVGLVVTRAEAVEATPAAAPIAPSWTTPAAAGYPVGQQIPPQAAPAASGYPAPPAAQQVSPQAAPQAQAQLSGQPGSGQQFPPHAAQQQPPQAAPAAQAQPPGPPVTDQQFPPPQ